MVRTADSDKTPLAPGTEGRASGDREIRGLLFDLDGTLIDSIPLIVSSLRHAVQSVLGIALSDEVLMHNIGKPLIYQLRDFSEEHADELLLVYRKHNAEHHDSQIKAYPGTAESLEVLSEMGYPMGVVTSKAREGAIRGLEVSGLASYFDVLVAYEDTEKHKPEPEPLLYAAELLGVPVEQCIYVGDSEFDMMAAGACNAIGAAALWGPFPAERVLRPGPRYALGSVAELSDLLDETVADQSERV